MNTEESSDKIYKFENEDHTLGNLLQNELLKKEGVLFAGYYKSHPQNNYITLRMTVDAGKDSDEILKDAFLSLIDQFKELKNLYEHRQ